VTGPIRVRVTAPYWRLAPAARIAVGLEVEEAALDNCGVRDITSALADIYWFPTPTHATGFRRRLGREVPEVSTVVLGLQT
jgi:hypothetical protein